MIRYKVKDIVEAVKDLEIDVLAHQANCFNTMGAGVAKALADNFPELSEVDQRTVKGDRTKLGTSTSAWNEGNCTTLFNLYGQYGYSRVVKQTDYKALRSAIRAKKRHMKFETWLDEENKPQPITIGLPKIGAGLGGGDWNTIEKIIEEELGMYDVTIYVIDADEIPEGGERVW